MDLPIRKWLAFRLLKRTTCGLGTTTLIMRRQNSPIYGVRHSRGVRLRTGLVFSWGGGGASTPTAACTVQPTEVMVGEPITATVAVTISIPSITVTYAWTGNGGQVTGKDTTAQSIPTA